MSRDNWEMGLNRRNVLKSIGGATTLAAVGTGTAAAALEDSITVSAEQSSVNLNALLQTDTVESITRKIPNLELQSDDAVVIGNGESFINVPANYGALIIWVSGGPVTPHSNSSDDGVTPPSKPPTSYREQIRAGFFFKEWVDGVDDDWEHGTSARLIATEDGPLLQRTATDEEKRQYLARLNQPEFDEEQTMVAVIPEYDVVSITHQNKAERQFKTVQAVERGQEEDGLSTHTTPNLEVINEETYGVPDQDTISAASGCSRNELFDALNCLIENVNCVACRPAFALGPWKAGICIFVVCLGKGTKALAEKLTDHGCSEVAECLAEELLNRHDDSDDDSDDGSSCGDSTLDVIKCTTGPITLI